MLSRFDTIPERDGRTDRRTDGRNYVSIAVLARDNDQYNCHVSVESLDIHVFCLYFRAVTADFLAVFSVYFALFTCVMSN